MTDTVLVERRTETIASGETTISWVTIYSGKGRVKAFAALPFEHEVGARPTTITDFELALPYAAQANPGDRATVTYSRAPGQSDQYIIIDSLESTRETKRRFRAMRWT